MPLFTYTATNSKSDIIKGTLETADKAAVTAALSKQGLRPLSIKEGSGSAHVKAPKVGLMSKKVKMNDLVIFTRELSAMVGAGVPHSSNTPKARH